MLDNSPKSRSLHPFRYRTGVMSGVRASGATRSQETKYLISTLHSTSPTPLLEVNRYHHLRVNQIGTSSSSIMSSTTDGTTAPDISKPYLDPSAYARYVLTFGGLRFLPLPFFPQVTSTNLCLPTTAQCLRTHKLSFSHKSRR